MTARRRRKSGSGPSATALIAWVGGVQAGLSAPAAAPASVIHGGPPTRMSSGRAILVGRACGLAAGTLLACGSVLASATHIGDGSLAGDSAPLPNQTPVVPGTSFGAPDPFPADAPAERTSAAPDPVSARAVAGASSALHPRLGQIRRNNPVSLDTPVEASPRSNTVQRPFGSPPPATGHAPGGPIARVAPVLDPAAKDVGRVAPVGGVLSPASPRNDRAVSAPDQRTVQPLEPVKQVVAPVAHPVQTATQPAMAMLTSLLPIG
jgi:hypothetical protein